MARSGLRHVSQTNIDLTTVVTYVKLDFLFGHSVTTFNSFR